MSRRPRKFALLALAALAVAGCGSDSPGYGESAVRPQPHGPST